MLTVRVVGVTGGSGSGKSTVAISLCRKYPEKIVLIHIDDYFVKSERAPRLGEFVNWDHPDAIRFDDLYKDLTSLRDGQKVTILTKSELYNPSFDHGLRNKIEYTVEPKPIILLEGYLVLYDKRIRDLVDLKIYLDMPIEQSTKRRSSNKFLLQQDYYNRVLMPMYEKYVLPTKGFADFIVDVSNKKPDEILALVESIIFQ